MDQTKLAYNIPTLTEAADKPNAPIAAGVGVLVPWRLGTLVELSMAVRWAAKVWRTKGLRKSPFHFYNVRVMVIKFTCRIALG